MTKILDLGCGRRKIHPDATGVDAYPLEGVDVVADLNTFPYPFPDQSYDVVNMSSILEHLHDTIRVVEEVHRILKDGGILNIRVPHYSSRTAYCCIQHIRYYSTDSFNILQKGNPEYSKALFTIEKKRLNWSGYGETHNIATKILGGVFTYLANLNLHLCERYWCYYVGGFEEIEITLKKDESRR